MRPCSYCEARQWKAENNTKKKMPHEKYSAVWLIVPKKDSSEVSVID